jgi:tetratricopeptide (TPR) repeat protein
MSLSGQLLAGNINWGQKQVYWHPHTARPILHIHSGCILKHATMDGRLLNWDISGAKIHLLSAEPSPVLHTLVPDPFGKPIKDCRCVAVHGNGRLAIAGHSNGVSLFDLATNLEVGRLDLGATIHVCVDPSNGDLLTFGYRGLHRWPVNSDLTSGRLVVGPPQRLLGQGNYHCDFNVSQDGTTIAVSDHVRALVLRKDSNQLPVVLAPMDDVRYVDVSPDGRWAITHVNNIGDYRMWDTHTGELVARPKSPEEVINRNGVWNVETVLKVQPSPNLENAGANVTRSPRSPQPISMPYMVKPRHEGGIVLKDRATDRSVAFLDIPEESQTSWHHAFTPDGAQLVHSSADFPFVYVWDLRALRRHLAELGLDWEGPGFPPEQDCPHGRYALAPLEVTILGGDLPAKPGKYAEHLRAQAFMRLTANPLDPNARFQAGKALLLAGHTEQAYRHLSISVDLQPDHELARYWRADTACRLQRWPEVIADMTVILEKGVENPPARVLRAEALRQLGRYAEAVADLNVCLQRIPQAFSYRTLRARCYQAMGETARANADLEQARTLLEPTGAKELNSLAWEQLIIPESMADMIRALLLSEAAVGRDPNNQLYVNTLGVAQYRNGDYHQAIATLTRSLELGKGATDGFDQFFLAMCHAKLNNTKQARDLFAQAVRWVSEKKNIPPIYAEELQVLRKEAEVTISSNGP